MNVHGPPFHGKFRGVVSDNQDPDQKGRIRARVADVYGEDESGWALPASPYAGSQVGFYMIPPTNSWVWIEFEHGDPNYPIWSGCFWGDNQLPSAASGPDVKIIKTSSTTVTLDDTSGSEKVKIETSSGLTITMDSNGIEIKNGSSKILLDGQKTSVNDGALEVE